MTIRESIIHFQDKQVISNITLCKKCDIATGNYSSFRAGRRNLTWEQLQRVLYYLKLQITEL
jgi:hypothetical protein